MMLNTRFSRLSLLALVLTLLLNACADKTVRIYDANVPQYQAWDEFRSQSFSMEPARKLQQPGRIYLYRDLLIVNEFMEGLHFFDNANPASPQAIGFLPIHANTDMGVRNNILYVDSYTDLLSFDISNPSQPQFLNRVESAFRFDNYVNIGTYDPKYPLSRIDDAQGVVTGWKVEQVSVESEDDYYKGGIMEDAFLGNSSNNSSNVGGVGIAGSMATFAIVNEHLYILQDWELITYSISGAPVRTNTQSIQRMGETLFPAGDLLFIGSTTGMLIYELNNPAQPAFVSIYDHLAACDPVVVQGNRAYVTLRNGTDCINALNQLEVIDISNLQSPVLLHTVTMENPRGLGVDENILFICDGPAGLKVYDKSNEAQIAQNMLGHFPGITAQDVIPHNQVLTMTSAEGIYQYSYANPANITLISFIPVQP